MSLQTKLSAIPRNWLLIIFASLILIGTGCGSQSPEASLDPLNLLSHYKEKVPRHHPYDLVEMDLGAYAVTIGVQDNQVDVYRISFTATAILPKGELENIKKLAEEYQTRIRDMVNESAKTMSVDHMSDPHQAWLKSEILANLARMFKTRAVRDVVFSDYSFDRS